jgi:hypothetical protein
MFNDFKSLTYLSGALPLFLFGAMAASTPAAAACQGPGAPTTTQTRCVTAIALPTPLQSWDISWVNPERAEYYLGDRSNNAIDIIDTEHLKFKRSLGQFKGTAFTTNSKTGAVSVDSAHSGPNGVVTHGRWLYAGDGDSTLKVFDLDSPTAAAQKANIPTGGSTRVDEMALTSDGRYLLAANNAEDPTFATLFRVNGDDHTNSVTGYVHQTKIDPNILPTGHGLSLEQPTWDPKTQRFYTSIPIIANNPTGCNYGQNAGPITCSGGLLVTDPLHPKDFETAFDGNTGVVPLINCGPNGSTKADFDNLLLGCDSHNLPGSTTTTVINAKTKNQASVQGIVGSDEVWFNEGDDRYYLAARYQAPPTGTLGSGSVLGVVDITSVLVEAIPQSSGTHSVAADSKRNRIFVPQAFTRPVSGPTTMSNTGTDTNTTNGANSPTVGQQLCGTDNGCIVVYEHDVDEHEDRVDHGDHGDHS